MIIPAGQNIAFIPNSRQGRALLSFFMPGTVHPSSDESFQLNGGQLIINPAYWNHLEMSAFFGSTRSLTVDPGGGGTLLIDHGSLNRISLPSKLNITIRLTSTPPADFSLQFLLSTLNNHPPPSARNHYDHQSNQTIIQLNADYNAISSIHTTITIPGNPYHLPGDGRWQNIAVHAIPRLDGNGNVNLNAPAIAGLVCYLAGTLIDTPKGPVAIEDLRPGDAVHSFHDGRKKVEYLRWVGLKRVTPTNAEDSDTETWPVTIKAHALGRDCPFRDLSITGEHCLYLKGAFIPVRMLVNGRSIIRERRKEAYEIHHIETYEHRIISANGALSETYLDTGNRASFITPDGDARLTLDTGPARPGWAKTWERDAAAPLRVDRAFAEPLHAALAREAERLGLPCQTQPPRLTDDPALTLLDPQGRPLILHRKKGAHHIFLLEGAAPCLVIASRTARPSETIGPFVDDRRKLGVLVGSITLHQPDGSKEEVTTHLTAPAGTGWDMVEATACRWTNGRARLPLPAGIIQPGCLIEIEILSAGPYSLSAMEEEPRPG